ncbi:MAG: metal ABC transporter permease [Actinomycetales bacterium]|nr:metal ABC transporter permease [Actinomycetales bacterium]
MTDMLALDFMQRALLAAVLVGATAPLVGVFLLQRRLALIGDGMGHVALAGVAVGLFFGQSPVWTALVCAIVAAVVIELIRTSGTTHGDVALALIFYGGIAASVVIIAKSPRGTPASLTAYLFGAITTVAPADLWTFAALSVVIVAAVAVLRTRLFAVASDEEYARSAGLPVLGLNLALAVLTAVTVVVSMRIVGLLLISALMIVPNAAAQRLGRSFSSAMAWAVAIGLLSATGGVVISYAADTPSGGTIVLLAIAVFIVVALGSAVAARVRRARRRGHPEAEGHGHEHGPGCGHEAVAHGDHVDYLHDGHRHAPHGAHYDEHPRAADPSHGSQR